MQERRLIALAVLAVLIPGIGFGMFLEKAQQPTIKGTELQRHDLSVSGREIVQARIEFGTGMAFGKHPHPGEEVLYVLEGSLEYQVDGKSPVTLRAGDALFVPAEPTGERSMADKPFIARGFHRRGPQTADALRLPPGQYETKDFPVLSAGPTPRTPLSTWDFTIRDSDGRSVRWSWDEFQTLPRDTPSVDIHCVTKWSKFGTRWEGVSVDTLLAAAAAQGVGSGPFVLAFCDGGYTTNLSLADVTGGKAWVAFGYDGAALPAEHGGPARLLVPHLYFWKSAKWVRGLQLLLSDKPGFWEQLGYHDRGDPWREQRYQGDP